MIQSKNLRKKILGWSLLSFFAIAYLGILGYLGYFVIDFVVNNGELFHESKFWITLVIELLIVTALIFLVKIKLYGPLMIAGCILSLYLIFLYLDSHFSLSWMEYVQTAAGLVFRLVLLEIGVLIPLSLIFFSKRIRERKARKIRERLTELEVNQRFAFSMPGYLPDDYSPNDLTVSGSDDALTVELIYSHSKNEHIIWLTESKNRVETDSSKLVTTTKIIKGTEVALKQPKSGRKPDTKDARFFEATWHFSDMYFNLRVDGLQMRQIEKVVESFF